MTACSAFSPGSRAIWCAFSTSAPADGYVFRTDLRLRPDPRSTPLAMSVAAALAYYESVGQNWERAALIKARPVAGDRVAGAALSCASCSPSSGARTSISRRSHDIHSIKRQINAHRGGGRIAVVGHDIKIGRGGIREIEFFAQTQQLIWGGRMRELRVGADLRGAAPARRGRPHRSTQTATELTDDYRFLRRVEHRLQMVDDAQTHRLPDDADGLAQLAVFLGYSRRRGVRRRAASAISPRSNSTMPSCSRRRRASPVPAISSSPAPRTIPDTLATLARLGFADPAAVAAMVRDWHHGRMRATRSQRAREILTELVPELLRIFGAHRGIPMQPCSASTSSCRSLPAGVQLFSLFHANPGLSALVADIMAEAPLSGGTPGAAAGAARCGADRGFSRAAAAPRRPRRRSRRASRRRRAISRTRSTCCAAGPTSGASRSACSCCAAGSTALRRRRPMPISPRPCSRALLPAVDGGFRAVAWRDPRRRLRVIGDGPARQPRDDAGLRSRPDPDLRRAGRQREVSDGERPLAIAAYYARLSQRLIGAITAPTAEGRLYEVDMRLRPSGASGPIASSLAAFRAIPARSGLDLGAYGADPGAPGGRRRGAARADRGGDRPRRCALPRDPDRLARRRRRHAPAHRRRASPRPSPLGSAQPARRPGRSRIHRRNT